MIAVIVFVGVEGVLIYCLFRYRARKGRVAAQIHGNTRLEIGWTVGAAVILVFLTVATFVMLPGIKNPAASDIDANGNPVASNAAFASTDQEAAAERRGDEHRRRRDAVRLALRVPVDRRQEGLLVHGHVRARGHDDDARHPLRTTCSTRGGSRSSAARWTRCPGYTNKTLVQGDRAGRLARPVRRAVRAQPRQHVRARCIGLPYDEWKAWYDRQADAIATAEQAAGRGAQAARRQRGRATESSGETRVGPMASIETTPPAGRPSPQIIDDDGTAGADGLDLVDHHDRPQADRDPVPLDGRASSSCSAASRRC